MVIYLGHLNLVMAGVEGGDGQMGEHLFYFIFGNLDLVMVIAGDSTYLHLGLGPPLSVLMDVGHPQLVMHQ